MDCAFAAGGLEGHASVLTPFPVLPVENAILLESADTLNDNFHLVFFMACTLPFLKNLFLLLFLDLPASS